MKLIGLGAIAAALYLMFRKGSSAGSEVSSIIAGFSPTQLGLPQSMIANLSYQQISDPSIVKAFIDPNSGQIILNKSGLVNGSVPLVALTSGSQIAEWNSLNPVAVKQANQNQILGSGGSIQSILGSL